MKFIISGLLLILTMTPALNVSAATYTEDGITYVKTGFRAFLSNDNDGDGVKDRNDSCKDTAITKTFIDDNGDGCDDATAAVYEAAAAQNQLTIDEVINSDGVSRTNINTDGDSYNDDIDGCPGSAPTTDPNANGCNDMQIRTMLVSAGSVGDTVTISGIAFVDGLGFASEDQFTIEVEFHNTATGEFHPGEFATNYYDPSINTNLIAVREDASYGAFTINFDKEFFADFVVGQQYSVDITLTDQNGTKYTETLFSYIPYTAPSNDLVTIEVIDGRTYLTVNEQVPPAPTSTCASGTPEWDPNQAYDYGDTVCYQGVEYTAQWWTSGEVPGEADVWEKAETIEEWNNYDSYDYGELVMHDGQKWKAKWWNQNEEPGVSGAWELQ